MKKSTSTTAEAKPSVVKRVRHSDRHHTMTAKTLKLVIALCLLAIAGLVIVLAIMASQLNKRTGSAEATAKAAQLVTGATNPQDYIVIDSSLGFSVGYDNNAFIGEGQIGDPTPGGINGTVYKGDQLRNQRRGYINATFTPKPNPKDPLQDKTAPPYAQLLVNRKKDFWSNSTELPENKGKTKLDILAESQIYVVTQRDPSTTYKLESKADLTINGVVWRKLVFASTTTSFGFTRTARDIDYVTVQNDRPYWFEINGFNDPGYADIVAQFESILKTVTFSKPDTSLYTYENNGAKITDAVASVEASAKPARLAATTAPIDDTKEKLPSGTANVPSALAPQTILKVVAKNQPAVVRVATLRCVNVDLLLPDGSVGLNLPNACGGGEGSGSFVSSDGYIATNGHVVYLSDQEAINGNILLEPDTKTLAQKLQAMLGYLVKAKIVTPDDVNTLIAALQKNDPQALAIVGHLANYVPAALVKVKSDQYSYSIQTSDEPMRLDQTNGTKLKYTKTVISAKRVALDFAPDVVTAGGIDLTKSKNNSDVAILKAEGTFPIVRLGSIDNLKQGDRLTAIGYPAFVDGGIFTEQKTTVPSVTQGKVDEIINASEQDTHKLVTTSVPIAAGNSGGPAFADNGLQIGLNTYGKISCADDRCFGDGTARDIGDYKALLASKNIKLKTDSSITKQWSEGIDAYIKGDYKLASSDFKAIEASYPANYLASKFAELSDGRIGGPDDISAARDAFNRVLFITIGVAALVILALVGLIIYLLRGRHQPPQAAAYPGQAPYGPQPVAQPMAPQQPYSQPAGYAQPVAQPVQYPVQQPQPVQQWPQQPQAPAQPQPYAAPPQPTPQAGQPPQNGPTQPWGQ